ncbi:MAG: nickel-dependent lactate racemase [Promethearchaeota archaeon]
MSELVRLDYGFEDKEKVTVEVPRKNIIFYLKPNEVPGVNDGLTEIKRALYNPIEAPRLDGFVKKGKKIVLLANDYTRLECPDREFLLVLYDEFKKIGIKNDDVTVIVALGSHEPRDEKMIQKFGKDLYEKFNIVNHSVEEEALVDLGKTPSGTPISINKILMNSDIKIGLGNIIPHFIPGWGAGSKILQPGVMGDESTAGTHILSVQHDVNHGSIYGEAENPIRAEMDSMAKKVDLNYIVNSVINHEKEIVKVFAGDTIKAHRAGIETAKQVFFSRIPEKADIIIASSHPADYDLWQTTKGLYGATFATKKGGTAIVASAARAGLSKVHGDTLLELVCEDPYCILGKIESGEIDEDPIGQSIAAMWSEYKERANIIVVTDGVSDQDLDTLGFGHAANLDEALELAFKQQGKDAKIGIIESSADIVAKVF